MFFKTQDRPTGTVKTAIWRRFFRNSQGAGAVEFALIAPVLLLLYLGAFEITVVMGVTRKVSHASSSVADLVAAQTSVDLTYLSTMKDVVTGIIAPYVATGYTMKITGITLDSTATAKVTWSWNQDGGRPYTANTVVTVPSDLAVANTFLVRTELSMPYSLMTYSAGFSSSALNSITLSKTFYYRQRVGSSVTCSAC